MKAQSSRPAAFLDRDGTLIVEYGFLSDPDAVEPLPGAVDAVKTLNDWGYFVIGVTNQSGVARGYYDEAAVRKVNQRVIDVFARNGARIDRIYYCPHYPGTNLSECECRKPKRGMIDQAMKNHDIDLPHSLTIGDRICDVKLGQSLGIPGVLVLTGYGREELAGWNDKIPPDHVAESLHRAVQWLGERRNPTPAG